MMATATKRASVSVDVLRAILSELDEIDSVRLEELNDVLLAHLREGSSERRDLSPAARAAWDELEAIESRMLALKTTIRRALDREGS